MHDDQMASAVRAIMSRGGLTAHDVDTLESGRPSADADLEMVRSWQAEHGRSPEASVTVDKC
jgi:hypothetical protein